MFYKSAHFEKTSYKYISDILINYLTNKQIFKPTFLDIGRIQVTRYASLIVEQ